MIERLFLALCLLPPFVHTAAAQQPKPKNPPAPVEAEPKPAPRVPPADAPERKPVERPVIPPRLIGTFGDWIAVELDEDGQKVCYTFTGAQTSAPAIPNRGPVTMSVAHRQSGRNSVAIDAGFPFAAGAFVTLQADQASAEFYTARRAAFARDGAAAVAVLRPAGRAIVRSPGPRGETVTDTFSLKGFAAAHTAIGETCPQR